jgi:hypothetical protein
VRFDLLSQLLRRQLRMLQLLTELLAGLRRDRKAIITESRTPQSDRSGDLYLDWHQGRQRAVCT